MSHRAMIEKRDLWTAHAKACAQCSRYDAGKTATMAHCCLAGARLLKSLLEEHARTIPEERPEQ